MGLDAGESFSQFVVLRLQLVTVGFEFLDSVGFLLELCLKPLDRCECNASSVE